MRGASPRSRRRRRCRPRTGRREAALVEILRGRLEGPGAGHAGRAGGAARAGAGRDRRGAGGAARSKASPCAGASRRAANAEEWCDRRLLARIHHYTVKRLRAEIEPVAARDFLRFLFAWQRVTRRDAPGGAGCGRRGRRAARRLRGAGRRLGERDPAGAHRRLRAGLARRRVPRRAASPGRGCGRAAPRPTAASAARRPVRTTPITLLARRQRAALARACRRSRGRAQPSGRAQAVADFIARAGRVVLRRAGRRRRAAAPAGRGGAGRAGGARPRRLPTVSAGCARCCVPSDRRRPIAGAAPRRRRRWRSAWRTPAAGR